MQSKGKSIKKEREYLTAIEIDRGIIKLIEPDGSIGFYRQRGIKGLPEDFKIKLVSLGFLHPKYNEVKELPRNYSIAFEDEEIMGRAYAKFRIPRV